VGHQDWLPLGVRLRVLNWLYNPETAASKNFELDFFGFTYPGNLTCYFDWWVYFFGAYEKQELFCLRDLLHLRGQPAVFVDVGASVGHHSLFMARYADQVHSFEPWEVPRKKLLQKVAANGLRNVMAHPVGLGRSHCLLEYFSPAGANIGTGSFVSTHARDRNHLFEKLPVVKGDDYFGAHDISRTDVIKIDVEGFELEVLVGLRSVLERDRPIIFAEWSDTTALSCADTEAFRSSMPQDYRVLMVRTSASAYWLDECDFPPPMGNVLLLPNDSELPAGRARKSHWKLKSGNGAGIG
jgi:FkbM family methyltransferase